MVSEIVPRLILNSHMHSTSKPAVPQSTYAPASPETARIPQGLAYSFPFLLLSTTRTDLCHFAPCRAFGSNYRQERVGQSTPFCCAPAFPFDLFLLLVSSPALRGRQQAEYSVRYPESSHPFPRILVLRRTALVASDYAPSTDSLRSSVVRFYQDSRSLAQFKIRLSKGEGQLAIG